MEMVIIAGTVFVLSLVGGFGPRWFAPRLSNERLHDITGISAGLLLASALLVVIPEGFDIATAGQDSGFTDAPVVLGAAILAGFALMLVLEGFGVGHDIHEEHHSHAEGHGHGHVHHPSSLGIVAVGLSVHAIADGLAIGAAAVSGETAFGVLVAVAVVIHRVPAAFSLGLFALHETVDRGRVALGVIAFAVSTPIAILGTYLLLDVASDRWIARAMLFSAGTFVYVATVDTLPAIHNPETGRRSVAMVVLGTLTFAAVFVAIDQVLDLSHGH
jgi:solute carrier family 39 (zinc transporter), member 9